MRRLLVLLLVVATLLCVGGPALAHEGSVQDFLEEHPRLRSRPVDAHLIEELHERHGHVQWDRGRGDWGHSWATYRVEAAKLRHYLDNTRLAVHHFGLIWHWSRVADCESSGNWSINTGNGYYGGLQFSMSTWRAYGGEGSPQNQPNWYQATIADRVRTQSGLQHWPVCGRLYR